MTEVTPRPRLRSDTFKNELGSTIKITVLVEKSDVTLLMRGPNSDSVNIITRLEAQKLCDLLAAALPKQEEVLGHLKAARLFVQDCIETGHERGRLGNLYATRDEIDNAVAKITVGSQASE